MVNRSQEEIMQKWPKEWSVPMASIRCIAYNQECFIADALDGFLMQETDFPFEIIVHDDASTDKTADVIRSYEKKYPRIIKPIYEAENQFSKHDGSLRRIVNAACGGKYVALCEGDDCWINPFKLQRQIEFLEKNPDYSMCFHRAKIEKENPNLFADIQCGSIEDRDYTADEIFENWIIPTASVVFRRSVYQFQLESTDKFINGDVVLFLTCLKMGKIRGMSETMSVYRLNGGGVTQNKQALEKRALLYPVHNEAIKENFSDIISVSVFNKKQIKRLIIRAILYKKNAKYKEMAKDLFCALKLSPVQFIRQMLKKTVDKIKSEKK